MSQPVAAAAPALDALGDPTRRRVLALLRAGEQTVGTTVALLQASGPISQPAVSQHLKVLLEAGLVTARADGTRRFYAIDRNGIEAARSWLDQLVDPVDAFTQPLDALATEIARGTRARRQSARGGGRHAGAAG